VRAKYAYDPSQLLLLLSNQPLTIPHIIVFLLPPRQFPPFNFNTIHYNHFHENYTTQIIYFIPRVVENNIETVRLMVWYLRKVKKRRQGLHGEMLRKELL